MKIQDLASQTHASNATIHRFTRKLGFDGYSDFKSFLKFEDSKNHQLPSDSMEQFKQEIENTFNYLERIDYRLLTHKMHHATTIYLYGTGRAQMNVAEEAQRILLTMHKNKLRQKYFISVTTMKDNTLAQQADYNVYVSSNTFYLNDGTDYSSFISYHIFFETLLRKYNEYKENHELT